MASSNELLAVLQKTSEMLDQYKPFPFFGTLLGLTRDGKPIEGDDDVDLYLDSDFFADVRHFLASSPGITITQIDESAPYLQIRLQHVSKIPIDLYFFEIKGKHLVEKWNFAGLPNIRPLWMKAPSALIFPLRQASLGGEEVSIWFPSHPEELLAFLYGRNWQFPRQKGAEYFTLVLRGRPRVVEGPLARLGLKLSRLIWSSGALGPSRKAIVTHLD